MLINESSCLCVGPEISGLYPLSGSGRHTKICKPEFITFVGEKIVPVNDDSNCVTILELGCPNGRSFHISRDISASLDTTCLLRGWVLVDGDDLLVGHDCQALLVDFGEVTANNERCLADGPESKMSSLLPVGEATISNLKHVGVIPTTRT